MTRKRRAIPSSTRYHRPVLTDVLPYETPPTFSNGGYFAFLTQNDVKLIRNGDEKWVVWEHSTALLDPLIEILFGPICDFGASPETFQSTVKGKTRSYRKYKLLTGRKAWSRPYDFDISHKKEEFRRLSVIHPKDQLFVADFYDRYSSSILYYSSLSEFSIRRPDSVATTTYYDDKIHQSRKGMSTDFIEEEDKEYSNLGSYFSYSSFSNIYKFYEHYTYHNAEKKFGKLLKLDISKCFDSIYTHTVDWCVFGKEVAKDNLGKLRGTYSHEFDLLMQNLNRGETNGIVIGPEFSRIFAETLLQDIDRRLLNALRDDYSLTHKKDYRAFRYVDDYFVFYNSDEDAKLVQKTLSLLLREIKLNLNTSKSEDYVRPIITPQTIAKNKIFECLSSNIRHEIRVDDASAPIEGLAFFANSKNLIVGFKTILFETQAKYSDHVNYTLALVEGKLANFAKLAKSAEKSDTQSFDLDNLANTYMKALEFCFFIFAAEPRVNFSIRLARIISSMADLFDDLKVHRDVKHQVYKYVKDNIVQQLDRSNGPERTHIEAMYLLLALRRLGRPFLLPERYLAKYFGIELHGNDYKSCWNLDYFSFVVSVMYLKNNSKYQSLKRAIESEILDFFERRRLTLLSETESMLLYLDFQSCPYIGTALRQELHTLVIKARALAQSVDPAPIPTPTEITELSDAVSSNQYWFTNWGGFDLSMALDNKRARDVY